MINDTPPSIETVKTEVEIFRKPFFEDFKFPELPDLGNFIDVMAAIGLCSGFVLIGYFLGKR